MADQNFLPFPKGFATLAIHEAQKPEQWTGMDVITPISMSTTFKQLDPSEKGKYEYGRCGNPTREVLEKMLSKLEDGNYGACFSSGLGAVTTLLGLLTQGDHLICIDDVYGGTNSLLSKVASQFGIVTTFCEGNVKSFENALTENTKMFWVESPTNPTLQICDIGALSKLSRANDILLVVDNTFSTPFLQKPLNLGADIVMHSLTKYINGHADVMMGATVTRDEKIYRKIKYLQSVMGIVPSPFDCYQVLRGLKTLALRMKQHSSSSLEIAKYLENHPKVEKVLHPALSSHPQNSIAMKQMSGHSGVLSFYIKGDKECSLKFLKELKIFTLAVSIGGCESFACLPTMMTHASISQEHKEKIKITDNLIRLSVGLEDTEDLIKDLNDALEHI